ncbi:hypothetical protein S40288_08295 [Stachybotrys chartarum IBT 40288]|nr:hypothetical protein S40288_08295 [Stachybotrys chartarum IBT 40288]
MASVDEIFKQAGMPSKRKLDSVRDPNEIYKSAKLDAQTTERHARVGADADDGNDDDFGPELPPEDTDTRNGEGEDDDEEGRFFGGGITKQESEVLDFVEGADLGQISDKIDIAWLRKTALNFEKRITKNAELRAKYEHDPQRFITSEADLDADIKDLSVLSEHPELYPDFVALGCVASLVGLLAHENTDIAIDAIEIIQELTDEDVSAEDDQWNALTDALLSAGLLELLISNLSRLNEDDESDRNGVYHSLGVVENLCSRTATASQIGQDDTVLRWLLNRAQRKEATVTQNKQYATEILAILAQSSPESRQGILKLDAVDILLQLVAPYRKSDPEKGTEEEEFMENLFEALTCLADETEGKNKLIQAEGIELCLIMLKDGKMSKIPALRLLDHATAGRAGVEVCQKLVEAGGIKTTFTLFSKTSDRRAIVHLLAIFASMLRLLPADSAERIRVLAKFVEKDYSKIAKLVSLRSDYNTRIRKVEEESTASANGDELSDVELLSRRLDAGLHTLQTIDTILAWLAAEDNGARSKIQQLLAAQNENWDTLKRTISEQIEGLDAMEEDSQELKDMLTTLVEFL